MRMKITALALSALLPLSVWAMPGEGQGQQKQQAGQQQTKMQIRQEMMQKRQAAWFDRLELTAEQRQAFQKETQEYFQEKQKARTAHHDKLRALLTDEQRVIFDQDTEKRQQKMLDYMQKADKSPRSEEKKRSQPSSYGY